MVGFWGKRKSEDRDQRQSVDHDLAIRARSAIVATDERVRTTEDELGFVVAEIGTDATRKLREALVGVKEGLAEAFQLHQLNHDEIPDTVEELRIRNSRIVQLCDWVNQVLDEQTAALQEQVSRAREAPRVLEQLREDIERLRARLPEINDVVARLSEQYSPAALARLRFTSGETERLLDFALRSAELSQRRREAGKAEDATLALEAATETLRRAESMIDGVDQFEFEAIRAQATLADVIADSRNDLVVASGVPATPEVAEAASRLEAELARSAASAAAAPDPFGELAALSAANTALDDAVARARERAARPVVSLEHVRHDVQAADHALSVADGLINGHRGWIGADARTRYAEATRYRAQIDGLIASESTRLQAQQLARRTEQLANEAVRLAQRDIDSSRPDGNDWGWSGGRGGTSVLGPVLGGMLLGGIIDEIFD
ncbi:hypothetical protein VR010_09900 [Actinomycetaceae bacterium L2_0104]